MSEQEIIDQVIKLLKGKSFQESKIILFEIREKIAEQSILNPVE